MTGPFSPGLYWHRWGGWTLIVKAGIREYRAACSDGPATRFKLWGHVVYAADQHGSKRYPPHPGLRLSRAAWKDYTLPYQPPI